MMKSTLLLSLFALLLVSMPTMASAAPQVPVSGLVTMVDLGASSCIPCKMMAPILEKLTAEYDGAAAIIFIDVWQDAAMAKKFKVSMIPTQIFFDAEGTEVSRHVGFMAEEEIVTQLTKMGVARPAR
jgi:thioredoxin 1